LGGAKSKKTGFGPQTDARHVGLVRSDVDRLIRITPSQSDQGKGVRGP